MYQLLAIAVQGFYGVWVGQEMKICGLVNCEGLQKRWEVILPFCGVVKSILGRDRWGTNAGDRR